MNEIEEAVLRLLEDEISKHSYAWDYMMEAHNSVFNSTDICAVEVWVKECRNREREEEIIRSRMDVLKQVLALFEKAQLK